ncbi:MAG: relaxase domain-containing protein, partial [Verrucomicrobiae bacterium]|nr:relaxase domain-containing protein [Verrucomicrobiae bacterium]
MSIYPQGMITARTITNGSTYLARHLRANDYYAEGEKIEGEWIGKGARHLGLHGTVNAEQFEALRENRHPFTGERLTARDRKPYLAKHPVTGELTERKPIALHDITFSAPKTASIVAIIGEDTRVTEAFQESVRVAVREMEHFAAVRLRTGEFASTEKIRISGNITGALFFHDSSRALDPQLHAHAVMANASLDVERDQWFALQRRAMMEASPYIRRVLYHDFARRLRALGYDVEREGESFRIKGIATAVEAEFSLRTQQRVSFGVRYLKHFGHLPSKRRIEHFIREDRDAATVRFTAEFTRTFQREPTEREIRDFVIDWREPKLQEILTPQVRQLQRQRLSQDQFAEVRSIVDAARARRTDPTATIPTGNPKASVAQGMDHCLERLSVARFSDVLDAALRFGANELGDLDTDQLRAALLSKAGVITDRYQVTTEQALEEEATLLRFARDSLNRFHPLGELQPTPLMESLSEEQRHAVERLAASADGIGVLIGDAGTGKTHTLKALNEAHARHCPDGFIPLAPTTRATAELRANGYPTAATVASFLIDKVAQQEAEGRAILVDEAGLLSSRQMASLVRVAEAQRARLVLVGDTKQHESVERGSALRNLLDSRIIDPVRPESVRRQRKPEHRTLAQLLATGQAEQAFAHADSIGLVSEVPHVSRLFKEAAQHYANAVEAGRETLVVIPTWDEIGFFNDEARRELKRRGLIRGPEVEIAGSASLSWTAVEKCHWRDYRPGYVLNFHRSAAGVAPGESIRVKEILHNGLLCEKPDGTTTKITSKQRHAFDVAEPCKLEIAAGDALLFRANCPEIGVSNGDRLQVVAVDLGSIRLTGDKILPSGFTQICHGHAVTSHKSQGASVEESILVMAPHSLPAANLRQFYVSNTRFKDRHRVFVHDKNAIAARIGQRSERLLAREFLADLGRELHSLLQQSN